MKKYLIVLIGVCMLIFASCTKQVEYYNKSVSKNDTITYSLKGTSNAARLQKFIDNVSENKKDIINLVRYTTEGDPITTQLYFNGKNIEIAIDRSKDKFGGQDKDNILYDTIKEGNQLKDDLLKYLSDTGS